MSGGREVRINYTLHDFRQITAILETLGLLKTIIEFHTPQLSQRPNWRESGLAGWRDRGIACQIRNRKFLIQTPLVHSARLWETNLATRPPITFSWKYRANHARFWELEIFYLWLGFNSLIDDSLNDLKVVLERKRQPYFWAASLWLNYFAFLSWWLRNMLPEDLCGLQYPLVHSRKTIIWNKRKTLTRK